MNHFMKNLSFKILMNKLQGFNKNKILIFMILLSSMILLKLFLNISRNNN
jgi:hypothetical protein